MRVLRATKIVFDIVLRVTLIHVVPPETATSNIMNQQKLSSGISAEIFEGAKFVFVSVLSVTYPGKFIVDGSKL